MAAAKKPTGKAQSMIDEDRAFFESAYKNDPKARAAMDAEGRAPTAKKSTAAPKKAAPAAKKTAPTRKTAKK